MPRPKNIDWQDVEDAALNGFYKEFPKVGRNELAQLLQEEHDGIGVNSFISLITKVTDRLRDGQA